MSENNTEKSGNLIIGVVVTALVLGIFLLALGLIVTTVNNASISANGKIYSSGSAINETGSINNTGYTLNKSYAYPTGFSPTITSIVNGSNGVAITSGNWTLTGRILTNKTVTSWNYVNISYTFTYEDTLNNTAISTGLYGIQNNAISLVINFFALMPTIGTILAVVILIAVIVILVFYVMKIKGGRKEEGFSG